MVPRQRESTFCEGSRRLHALSHLAVYDNGLMDARVNVLAAIRARGATPPVVVAPRIHSSQSASPAQQCNRADGTRSARTHAPCLKPHCQSKPPPVTAAELQNAIQQRQDRKQDTICEQAVNTLLSRHPCKPCDPLPKKTFAEELRAEVSRRSARRKPSVSANQNEASRITEPRTASLQPKSILKKSDNILIPRLQLPVRHDDVLMKLKERTVTCSENSSLLSSTSSFSETTGHSDNSHNAVSSASQHTSDKTSTDTKAHLAMVDRHSRAPNSILRHPKYGPSSLSISDRDAPAAAATRGVTHDTEHALLFNTTKHDNPTLHVQPQPANASTENSSRTRAAQSDTPKHETDFDLPTTVTSATSSLSESPSCAIRRSLVDVHAQLRKKLSERVLTSQVSIETPHEHRQTPSLHDGATSIERLVKHESSPVLPKLSVECCVGTGKHQGIISFRSGQPPAVLPPESVRVKRQSHLSSQLSKSSSKTQDTRASALSVARKAKTEVKNTEQQPEHRALRKHAVQHDVSPGNDAATTSPQTPESAKPPRSANEHSVTGVLPRGRVVSSATAASPFVTPFSGLSLVPSTSGVSNSRRMQKSFSKKPLFASRKKRKSHVQIERRSSKSRTPNQSGGRNFASAGGSPEVKWHRPRHVHDDTAIRRQNPFFKRKASKPVAYQDGYRIVSDPIEVQRMWRQLSCPFHESSSGELELVPDRP